MNKLSNKPLYDQVFDQIKDMIRSGTYCAGDQLPSEKELMERMGVSRVTVRQALRLLADAGIIETRKGKGSIVSVDWKNLLDPGELKDQAEKYWRQFELSTKARSSSNLLLQSRRRLCYTGRYCQTGAYLRKRPGGDRRPESVCGRGQRTSIFPRLLMGDRKNPC